MPLLLSITGEHDGAIHTQKMKILSSCRSKHTRLFFFFLQLNTKGEFMTVLVHFISSYFVFFLAELVVWIITAFSLLKKHYIWRLMFMGLIYKMLHRNCPTFDLTNISQVCVRVIQRTNKHIKKRRTPLFQICKSHVLEFVRS